MPVTAHNKRIMTALCVFLFAAACGENNQSGLLSLSDPPAQNNEQQEQSSVFDLLKNSQDSTTTLSVNKYIWQASLEVLDFLPVETIDPFSGLIVTGYGRPPGGSVAYRAQVLVTDPSLDTRALALTLERADGKPVSAQTIIAVENAILNRAREIRVQFIRL